MYHVDVLFDPAVMRLVRVAAPSGSGQLEEDSAEGRDRDGEGEGNRAAFRHVWWCEHVTESQLLVRDKSMSTCNTAGRVTALLVFAYAPEPGVLTLLDVEFEASEDAMSATTATEAFAKTQLHTQVQMGLVPVDGNLGSSTNNSTNSSTDSSTNSSRIGSVLLPAAPLNVLVHVPSPATRLHPHARRSADQHDLGSPVQPVSCVLDTWSRGVRVLTAATKVFDRTAQWRRTACTRSKMDRNCFDKVVFTSLENPGAAQRTPAQERPCEPELLWQD